MGITNVTFKELIGKIVPYLILHPTMTINSIFRLALVGVVGMVIKEIASSNMVGHKQHADVNREVSSNQAGGINANIDPIGMERINAQKRVKRQATGNTEAKAGGATKAAGTGGSASSASDLIVYFPIYVVSLAVAVLQQ